MHGFLSLNLVSQSCFTYSRYMIIQEFASWLPFFFYEDLASIFMAHALKRFENINTRVFYLSFVPLHGFGNLLWRSHSSQHVGFISFPFFSIVIYFAIHAIMPSFMLSRLLSWESENISLWYFPFFSISSPFFHIRGLS